MRIISNASRGNLKIKSLLKYFYVLLTCACAVVCSVFRKRGSDVLLLRLDALGDFVLWLDSAKEYRKLYPDRKITLLVNASWLELAKALPYWDEVWSLDIGKFRYQPFYRIQMLTRIRRKGFAIVCQPRFSREFLLEDSIVLVSGAVQRIAFEGDCSNLRPQEKKFSDRWYTRLLPNPSSPAELERNAEFVRALGATSFQASVPNLDVIADRPAVEGEYYVIAPGAGRNFRCWPIEHFAQIADKIYAATHLKGVICGSESDKTLAARLMSLSKAPLIDVTGKTSLMELIGTIKGAKFVVGNETAAVHIAAAVGVKAICILGGGHFERFVPYSLKENSRPLPKAIFHRMDCYGCGWSCKFEVAPDAPVPCIANITVENVWQAINT